MGTDTETDTDTQTQAQTQTPACTHIKGTHPLARLFKRARTHASCANWLPIYCMNTHTHTHTNTRTHAYTHYTHTLSLSHTHITHLDVVCHERIPSLARSPARSLTPSWTGFRQLGLCQTETVQRRGLR